MVLSAILIAIIIVSAAGIFLHPNFSGINDSGGNGGSSTSENLLLSKDPRVYAELERNSFDTRVANRTAFMDYASRDFLNWDVYGNASVLNPGLSTYRQEPLTTETIQFFGNYSLALHQLGLPSHSTTDIYAVGNLTQNNKDIVNFNPIRLGDPGQTVNGTYINITPVPARECWTTVQQVKDITAGGTDIVNHPEMGLGVSTKVITNNWCLYDNPYGINKYDSSIVPNEH